MSLWTFYFYEAESPKNILVSREGNKTLLECFMPKLLLNDMNQQEKALAGRIEEVKRKYGVKFLE